MGRNDRTLYSCLTTQYSCYSVATAVLHLQALCPWCAVSIPLIVQALFWFKSPPRYFARCTRQDAAKQLLALEAFLAELNTVIAFWSELTHSKAYPSFAAVSLATGRLVATSKLSSPRP